MASEVERTKRLLRNLERLEMTVVLTTILLATDGSEEVRLGATTAVGLARVTIRSCT